MSYADPGWNDPYDWCLLLTSFGVPCSPAALGLAGAPRPVHRHRLRARTGR